MSARNGHALDDEATLQAKIRMARARTRLARMEAEAQLLEGWGVEPQPGYPSSFLDPFDWQRGGWGLGPGYPGTAGSRSARQDGGDRPFFWSEIDLERSRGLARWLATKNLWALGTLNTLTNYTIKTGFKWEAVPAPAWTQDAVAVDLAKQAQRVLDEFDDFNRAPEWEREAFLTSRRDGECLHRFFPAEDGLTALRPVFPEQLRQPLGSAPHCSYGIETDPHDVLTVTGYFVDYQAGAADGFAHDDYDAVPAEEMCHLKLNVDSVVKRGLSDFYACSAAFEELDKLLRNMRITAGVQSAIVHYERFVSASTDALSALAGRRKDLNRPQIQHPVTGRTLDFEHFEPGQIRLINGNREMMPAPLASNTTQHISILQAALRSLGRRWDMPEYMASGDACLSEDSEILTERGWVGIANLRQEDRIGTVHPETHSLEYQLPLRHFCNQRKGPMVHLKSRRFDLLVTPNHDVYLSKYLWRREEWNKVQAEDLLLWPHKGFKCLATPFNWQGGFTPKRIALPGLAEAPAGLVLRFLGIYLGDGSIARDVSRVAVAGITKPRKLRYYAPILEELGFKLHVDEGGRHHWYMDNRPLHDWLAENIGMQCETKRLPPLVWSLCASGLDDVWEGLLQSDGYNPGGSRRVQTYSTTSPLLADDVQILSLRRGKRASLSRCPPGQLGALPVFKVHVSSPKPAEVRRHEVRQVDYEGLVWCVCVPNGLIISRRNGKVAVSGNSNANYASTLVAGSPFVNAIECEQDRYRWYFRRWRLAALRIASQARRFQSGGRVYTFAELMRLVDVHGTPPQVAIANKRDEAAIDHQDLAARVQSVQSLRAKRGLDNDKIRQDLKEEPPTAVAGKVTDVDPSGNPVGKGPVQQPVRESKDTAGHQHKGKGEGGGQFTSGGGGGKKDHSAPDAGAGASGAKAKKAAEEYQRLGTAAPAFKSWFGDWQDDPANASKVVNKETGEPQEQHKVKEVHHGTRAEFTGFSRDAIGKGGGTAAGKGFYFAEDRRIAEVYSAPGAGQKGKVVTAYLNVRNPFEFEKEYTQQDADRLVKTAQEMERAAGKEFDPSEFKDLPNLTGWSLWNAVNAGTRSVDANDVLAKAGFDGLTHLSDSISGRPVRPGKPAKYGRCWIAFEPHQIKATDNKGTFDPASHNIHESKDSAGHEHKGAGEGGGQFTSGSGGSGGDKDKPSAHSPGKVPRATPEDARAHIKSVRANPTPQGVQNVARTLSRMTVKELTSLKKELGIRAGGNKSALTQKLAHEATRRLTVRQSAERQARAIGASPKDLAITARFVRQTHNEVADEVKSVLGEARRQFTQFTDGGRLTRGMKAFRGGDWTEIPHFDQIAASLQARYPDLLGQDEQDAPERLFTLLAGGPPPRMNYEESYRMAIDHLKESGMQAVPRRRAAVVEEPIPEGIDSVSRDRNAALLEVLLENADNPSLCSVVEEMAVERDSPAEVDEDDVPPSAEAQAASSQLMAQLVKERLARGSAG